MKRPLKGIICRSTEEKIKPKIAKNGQQINFVLEFFHNSFEVSASRYLLYYQNYQNQPLWLVYSPH